MAPLLLIIALIAAAAGFMFAATSTYDFVAHLDRQVHGLHCSFLPGSTPDVSGTSGCHVTLMSPYSSIMRDSIWGGIPISLPAMAVFAFLAFWAAMLWLSGKKDDRNATGFFALATGVPALTSIVMGTIAIRELDAVCKLCVGIYLSSAVAAVCALMLWLSARKAQAPAEGETVASAMSMGSLVVAFIVGCAFVGVSVVAYAAGTPDFDKYVGACGDLPGAQDPQNVLIPLGRQGTGPQIIEVVDPLCPACRAFERRFAALDMYEAASRRGLLFPLDNSCNWMVDSAVHPGACAISEAMLCAGDDAEDVLEWAFDEQESIVAAERAQAGSAGKLAAEHFPSLAGCIGSSKTRARLNRALRWAVDNHLPVLTPQLYVNGKRLCDADTDLGLDYMLTRLVERSGSGKTR